jgi:hypothetical protein
MNHAFRNPLVIEVRDLFPQDEVLQQGRPSLPGLERILVVVDAQSLIRRQGSFHAVFAEPGQIYAFCICVRLFLLAHEEDAVFG